MEQLIFNDTVDTLVNILEEGARADRKATSRFVEPGQGTLKKAQSKRHHIIFGRRGSGKSSLLFKSADELTKEDHPIAYVDLEPFKGHHYPDIIISVLIATLIKYSQWLESRNRYSRGKRLWYTLWILRKNDTNRLVNEELSENIKNTINELKQQLHLTDNSNLIEKIQDSIKTKSEDRSRCDAKSKSPIFEGSIESSNSNEVEEYSNKEIHEQFKRSKVDYLHRKILDLQNIFSNLNDLSNKDSYLFLDDLYHIRRSDQPYLLDYFHRIAKGNRLWLKIGTIRNRSTWYIHSPQSIGMKLGDDAEEINLDLTLEKFSTSRSFLESILNVYIKEAYAPPLNKFVGEGALDRLVLSSGGVARDFLGIFRRSIEETRERLRRSPKHHRGLKVGAEDVNAASGSYGDVKREEFQIDTSEDRTRLEEYFEKIRLFCLHKAKSNIFLIVQELKGSDNELLEELMDLRLIHHVHSKVTVSSRPGKVFRALLLDLSEYTGERARRDVEMIEFWKESRESLRKASLIMDHSISYELLKYQIENMNKGLKRKKKSNASGNQTNLNFFK